MAYDFLKNLGIEDVNSGVWAGEWIKEPGGSVIDSVSPITGDVIAKVRCASKEDYESAASAAQEAFEKWRMIPGPVRGQMIREMADELRKYKKDLGALVTLEMGKIRAEGEGEVQEMIDICDFAVGLSRQMYGKTMHSERPGHRMYEQWHPLGIVGIISAFNFPVAVWAWNSTIAAVCGNSMIWKPSSKTPLCAIAVQNIIEPVLKRHDAAGLMNTVVGRGSEIGETLISDKRVPLVSATGSCRMGRRIGEVVGKRLGRTILELGGNNAIIATADADLDMCLRTVMFGAVGTAGQRCTTTRRLIMHKDIARDLTDRLVSAYGQVPIGDPLDQATLMGPLIDRAAAADFGQAVSMAREQGGSVIYGGKVLEGDGFKSGCYVEPTLIKADENMKIWRDETFAPVLYLFEYEDVDEAIRLHNCVDQGLSSSMFTLNLREAESFLSHRGSDCGIANINVGTSGAEIGGAFGGEKDTGGGREAGSDAWKAYMRRQTTTINWTTELPLAQGIKFGD